MDGSWFYILYSQKIGFRKNLEENDGFPADVPFKNMEKMSPQHIPHD